MVGEASTRSCQEILHDISNKLTVLQATALLMITNGGPLERGDVKSMSTSANSCVALFRELRKFSTQNCLNR